MNLDWTVTAISAGVGIALLLFQRIYLRRIKVRKARTWLSGSSKGELPKVDGFGNSFFEAPKRLLNYLIIGSNYGVWLQKLLIRAGRWEHQELHRLVNLKLQAAIAGLIGIALARQAIDLSLIAAIPILLLAFFTPDLLLWNGAQNRITRIAESIPETIDLLGMCVTAGIGFHAGMQRVAMTRENPLSEEFSRVLSEMKLGQGRTQALLSMSERLGLEPLKLFVNSVLQVDRLGVPMAKVLEEQSNRMRVMRREKAREHAQKLPVKILAPIMLFMMPALLIIVLGPAIVTIIRSFT